MKQGRKIFLIVIILFAVLMAVYLAYNRGLLFKEDDISQNILEENIQKDEGQNKNVSDNVSNKYIQIKENFEDIEFADIELKLERTNKTELIAKVTNITDKYLEAKHIKIQSKDENGAKISEFAGILTNLAPYESSVFKAFVLSDITNATIIEFEEILD